MVSVEDMIQKKQLQVRFLQSREGRWKGKKNQDERFCWRIIDGE